MKPAKRYFYVNDKVYPLYEAPYQYTITAYKKDCKRAVVGDPKQCLLALGAMRDKAIEAAFIGAGQDAYLVFKKTKLRDAYALHFCINTKAAKVRDYFDTHQGVVLKQVVLSPPTAGRTLEHRSVLNKRRYDEIKNGAVIKERGAPRMQRIERLGVPRRPRARIENNFVPLPPKQESAA